MRINDQWVARNELYDPRVLNQLDRRVRPCDTDQIPMAMPMAPQSQVARVEFVDPLVLEAEIYRARFTEQAPLAVVMSPSHLQVARVEFVDPLVLETEIYRARFTEQAPLAMPMAPLKLAD